MNGFDEDKVEDGKLKHAFDGKVYRAIAWKLVQSLHGTG